MRLGHNALDFSKFHYLPRITLLVELQLHSSSTSNRVFFVSAYLSGVSVQEILTPCIPHVAQKCAKTN
jgi:hypothetical protein